MEPFIPFGVFGDDELKHIALEAAGAVGLIHKCAISVTGFYFPRQAIGFRVDLDGQVFQPAIEFGEFLYLKSNAPDGTELVVELSASSIAIAIAMKLGTAIGRERAHRARPQVYSETMNDGIRVATPLGIVEVTYSDARGKVDIFAQGNMKARTLLFTPFHHEREKGRMELLPREGD